MEDNKVPYIVFESETARHERTVKRMWIALLVAVALIFASNMAWLLYMNSFDTVATTTVQDAGDGGNASYIGGSNGVINNGKSDNNDSNAD